jgi:hypothetical protein
MTGESCHVFLAIDLTPGATSRELTEQDMRQQWFPQAEVEHMLRDGTIADSPTLAAYLLLTLRTWNASSSGQATAGVHAEALPVAGNRSRRASAAEVVDHVTVMPGEMNVPLIGG